MLLTDSTGWSRHGPPRTTTACAKDRSRCFGVAPRASTSRCGGEHVPRGGAGGPDGGLHQFAGRGPLGRGLARAPCEAHVPRASVCARAAQKEGVRGASLNIIASHFSLALPHCARPREAWVEMIAGGQSFCQHECELHRLRRPLKPAARSGGFRLCQGRRRKLSAATVLPGALYELLARCAARVRVCVHVVRPFCCLRRRPKRRPSVAGGFVTEVVSLRRSLRFSALARSRSCEPAGRRRKRGVFAQEWQCRACATKRR